MPSRNVHILDVVALLEDLHEAALVRGQVGTVVEPLAVEVFEIEFSDDEGRTYASLPLRREQLLVLHHSPRHVAYVVRRLTPQAPGTCPDSSAHDSLDEKSLAVV